MPLTVVLPPLSVPPLSPALISLSEHEYTMAGAGFGLVSTTKNLKGFMEKLFEIASLIALSSLVYIGNNSNPFV